jgi:ribose transport system substrate-binding protein
MGRAHGRRWALGVVAAAVAVMGVAAGCGSSDSGGSSGTSTASSSGSGGSVSVDVGTGTPVVVKKTSHPRIGLFIPDQTNGYMKSYVAAAKEEAKKLGAPIRIYDANFDANAQINQMQNAIQQKAIDVAVVHAADGTVTCNQVTKLMPEAGILANVVVIPQCDTGTTQTGKSGDELWSKGTLNYVGSNNTLLWNVKWFEETAKLNPGPQKAALVLGQATGGQSRVIEKAKELWQQQNPDSPFKVVDTINTDYSAPGTFNKVQSYLQAHPDVNVLMVASAPDQTQGTVKAVEQAGLSGKVKVVDQGGDPYSIEGIKNGSIQMSMPLYPSNSVRLAIDSIVKAVQGEKQPRYIDDSAANGYSIENPLVITKDNLDQAPKDEYVG